ncbi:glycosyltransferase family 2 protein [Formosa sp. 3Alg 14/1]|uniref:glycosyltransferase family 2 protein n=1 Tax=Formosa sp. 3Alg 14/1 TaxID=3382190 RepID=UPI0039BE83C1
MKAFFSVVIPLYNKQNHIKNTIDSVLKQGFIDFEIIIINDGSTDQSLDVINSISDSRLHIYTIKNQGVSFARNYGVNKATTNHIAFLDADDTWEHNHLESLYNLYQVYPGCGLYCTAYQKRMHDVIIPSTYFGIPNSKAWSGVITDFFEASTINCIAWTSAVSIPKHIFLSVKGFDNRIKTGPGEDIDLWIRLALKHPVAFTNTVTATHNLLAENRLSNSNKDLKSYIDLDQYEPFIAQHTSLKKYLDLNRFALALMFKVNSDELAFKNCVEKMDLTNINWKQKVLLKCNRSTLLLAKRLQLFLKSSHLHFSAFK